MNHKLFLVLTTVLGAYSNAFAAPGATNLLRQLQPGTQIKLLQSVRIEKGAAAIGDFGYSPIEMYTQFCTLSAQSKASQSSDIPAGEGVITKVAYIPANKDSDDSLVIFLDGPAPMSVSCRGIQQSGGVFGAVGRYSLRNWTVQDFNKAAYGTLEILTESQK